MKKKLFIFQLLLLITSIVNCQNINISGIVNDYTPVIAIDYCTNSINIVSVSAFSVGDRVLIIQMKGAEIDTTNTSSFGTIVDYQGAGNYEFGVISSMSGNTVFFQNQLLNQYQISGRVQLVRVPQYLDATITDTLTCEDWNGSTGGVLVIEVTDTLFMNSSVVVSSKGFRGGLQSLAPSLSSLLYYSSPSTGIGGYKGEGISELDSNFACGRGAMANGGGGGNAANAGGAGGGNCSLGGHGGYEYSPGAPNNNGGDEGKALLYLNSANKIFMGGGGGGGHQGDSNGSDGSNGGGIVIIKANTLIHNNGSFDMSADDADNSAAVYFSDGAGGGGSGGALLLDVINCNGTFNIDASGGDGGSVPSLGCHGPGGGGSGGVVWSSNPLSIGISMDLSGGLPGIAQCSSTPYGATNGQSGFSIDSLLLNESLIPFVPFSLDIGGDRQICQNDSAIFIAGNSLLSYSWMNGQSTNSIFKTNNPGFVWLEVADSIGCVYYDTVMLSMIPFYADSIIKNICLGDSIFLSGSYQNLPGIYIDSTISTSGCDSIIYTDLYIKPSYYDTVYVTICEGDSYFADGDYQTSSGLYYDNYLSNYNCDSIKLTYLTVNAILLLNLGPDQCIQSGESVLLDAGIDKDFYLWNDGSTNSTLNITSDGVFWVNACKDSCCSSDTININICPNIWVPNCFTPNGDGVNDVFTAYGSSVLEYNMKVYNRWGAILFQSFNMSNPWDGLYKGKLCQEGVYFYMIKYKAYNKEGSVYEREISGSLTLISK